jgi:glycosyltransferase involved in cell wall biosynthesis
MKRILIIASTFPVSKTDPVPSFVKEQAIWLKKLYPETKISVLSPHNSYSGTKAFTTHVSYDEYRFHYFWPHRWERLAGRGIAPALMANPLLYIQVPFLFIAEFFKLWKLTRDLRPDFIYAHWFTPQAITAAAVSRITSVPFVFTTHASDVSVLRKFPFSKNLVRWVCNRATAFTAVAGRTAEKLKYFFDDNDWANNFDSKLEIIPMGIEIKSKNQRTDITNKVGAKFGIQKDKALVLYLGRLAEKKGVKYLIEAIGKLNPETSRKAQFVIAGDGQLKKSLEELALQLRIENLIFTGYIHGADKEALLQLADYVCLPSIIDSMGDSEGLPVALMEGLSAGAILLVSDVSGGENVIQDRVNGYIFKQKSSIDLANKLKGALSLSAEDQRKFKIESKKLATQFNWKLITKKHYKHLFE